MTTPMMMQWESCKKAAPNSILLFRMGDFYEAFHDDAQLLARELDLTLTKRQEVPMSGVPHHTIDVYIERLVQKGHRVAVAEQTEDPKEAKGLVKREIVRIVTPGTILNSSLISEKSNNFLVALDQVGTLFGLAALDISTGEFRVIEFESATELLNEIARLTPSEFVLTEKFAEKYPVEGMKTLLEKWRFEHKTAVRYLTEHFDVQSLDGFGLKGKVAAINAAGALLAYVHEELSLSIAHIKKLSPYSVSETLAIDRNAQRHLELHDLLRVIDRTVTPMGGRLLKKWLQHPLLSPEKIAERQEVIEALFYDTQGRLKLKEALKSIRDLERLAMKVSARIAKPLDLKSLQQSLEYIAPVKAFSCRELVSRQNRLGEFSELIHLLKSALTEEGHFCAGYHTELDELRSITRGGKEWLLSYQARIKEDTGIKNLKVSFNKVFGYYIEVSRGQSHLMPDSFERRQTLVNSERFISPELKEYESRVLNSEERIMRLEAQLFSQLLDQTLRFEEEVFSTAEAIAEIDVLQALADVAKRNSYCRPKVDQSDRLEIVEGRHPVVEAALSKENFIANDTKLGEKRLMLITGPNMAGKSTYIRQVALLVILAQMGSFIPANHAHIGVVDMIFTRIGASDDLARGQSTFMVEMTETANILNNATAQSLIILDEIGRGTSTYDGVSIAWSVAEYLLKGGAKTLFATHYWELTQLESLIPGAVNYHASVEEWNEEIVFLHKIVQGGADKSYGIHVARLAGLPLTVVRRATQILKRLEMRKTSTPKNSEEQLTLF
ncbi:MAG: DNA mismatch repair protein MutS [Chlamydiales bacterium]|nr:DNA mismatch repair protein MutS [Chlamydiales bacterium]